MDQQIQRTMIRKDIQGWGADLDLKDRPAVPKERTPPRFIDVHWDQPEQQIVKIKKFHSIERPSITPVFGSSVPPTGLSGLIRTAAFRLSENDIRHWLMLMFADRINVVEGILQDLSRGYVPNIFAEMGIRAEYKYNRAGFYRKVAITAAVAGALGLWMAQRKRKSRFVAESDF